MTSTDRSHSENLRWAHAEVLRIRSMKISRGHRRVERHPGSGRFGSGGNGIDVYNDEGWCPGDSKAAESFLINIRPAFRDYDEAPEFHRVFAYCSWPGSPLTHLNRSTFAVITMPTMLPGSSSLMVTVGLLRPSVYWPPLTVFFRPAWAQVASS